MEPNKTETPSLNRQLIRHVPSLSRYIGGGRLMPDEGVSRPRAGGRLMRDEKDNENKKFRRIRSKNFRAKLCFKGIVVRRAGARR